MDFYLSNSISSGGTRHAEKYFFLAVPPFFIYSYQDGNLTININFISIGEFIANKVTLFYIYLGDEVKKELTPIENGDTREWRITFSIKNYSESIFAFRFKISSDEKEFFF